MGTQQISFSSYWQLNTHPCCFKPFNAILWLLRGILQQSYMLLVIERDRRLLNRIGGRMICERKLMRERRSQSELQGGQEKLPWSTIWYKIDGEQRCKPTPCHFVLQKSPHFLGGKVTNNMYYFYISKICSIYNFDVM